MGIPIASLCDIPMLFYKRNVERRCTVEVQYILSSVRADKSLRLDTCNQIVPFPLLVPDWMSLYSHCLTQLLEYGNEYFIRSNNIFAFNATVIDLSLPRLPLLKYSGDDTLANDSSPKIVNN